MYICSYVCILSYTELLTIFVVYNTPLYQLLFLSVLYSTYIIIKLLLYYYYLTIIFFPHERRGLHDPILVQNRIYIYIYI